MSLLPPIPMEEAYQFSFKIEEKLARKIKGKSHGGFRDRGP